MILITAFYSTEDIKKVTIEGHADKVICAGVSACFQGAINAFEADIDYKVESGDSYIQVDKLNLHDKIVLETLVVQLISLASDYSKEVKFLKKEVKK